VKKVDTYRLLAFLGISVVACALFFVGQVLDVSNFIRAAFYCAVCWAFFFSYSYVFSRIKT
jgi:hypothetical protein